jgi:hypothetical protein
MMTKMKLRKGRKRRDKKITPVSVLHYRPSTIAWQRPGPSPRSGI